MNLVKSSSLFPPTFTATQITFLCVIVIASHETEGGDASLFFLANLNSCIRSVSNAALRHATS